MFYALYNCFDFTATRAVAGDWFSCLLMKIKMASSFRKQDSSKSAYQNQSGYQNRSSYYKNRSSYQNRPDKFTRRKFFAKVLSLAHVVLALALNLFSVVNFGLAHSSLLVSFIHIGEGTATKIFGDFSGEYAMVEKIVKIAEYNGISGFMMLMFAAFGFMVWISPSPKKFTVKTHLVLQCVTAAILCIYLNFTAFNLIILSKLASLVALEDKSGDLSDLLMPFVAFQWLIVFVWFFQSNLLILFIIINLKLFIIELL